MRRDPTTKAGRTAVLAQSLAPKAESPEAAWLLALEQSYPDSRLPAQVRHTCPKWAFAALADAGAIRGLPAGSMPKARETRSGQFVLRALELVREDPSWLSDKTALRREVFGVRGSDHYRSPNDEVNVLEGLWQADLLLVQ